MIAHNIQCNEHHHTIHSNQKTIHFRLFINIRVYVTNEGNNKDMAFNGKSLFYFSCCRVKGIYIHGGWLERTKTTD